VEKLNILGITVSHSLTFHHHVSALVAKFSRSFYALKTICDHALYGNALWDITRPTLVSQLQYACPAWWYISKLMKGTGYIQRFFCSLDELREDADKQLFLSRYNPNHVLHRLLLQPKSTDCNLRQRTHNLHRWTSMLLWSSTLFI